MLIPKKAASVLEVRKATISDAPGIHELEISVFLPEDVFSIRRIRYLISSPTVFSLVAILDDGKIGANVIALIRRFSVQSGRIYKISVAPSISGNGWASCLLDEIEKNFKKQKIRKICAEVREGNIPSRNLFLKNGYSENGFLDAYYPNGEAGIKFWKKI
ncbi:MAG: GNAT family N-acetyltransferase [Candidatus Riflebacteria bacterium]|nr:GNAT family N-acetyltransferase [Candidatus Riflebacteria bacterium]